jgi:SAM-dependent methyltransferase
MLEGGKLALDIGCNIGFMTIMVAENFDKVIGVDILPNNIEIAREFYDRPNVTYLVGDALDLPKEVKQEVFDCIILTEVLEHVQNPDLLIKNCYNLLKNDGILIISTPNAFSLKYFLDYFTRRDIKGLLSKLDQEETGIGTEIDHIFNWDIFSLSRLFIINKFKIKDFDFAGAYLPNAILFIFRKLLGKELGEPKWLLPILGRFSSELVIKFKK